MGYERVVTGENHISRNKELVVQYYIAITITITTIKSQFVIRIRIFDQVVVPSMPSR